MHGIAAVEKCLRARRDVRTTRIGPERKDPYIRARRIDDALEHEPDGERIVLHALDDLLVARFAMRLQPDIGARPFDERRVPFLAALECLALDQIRPVA